MSRLRGLKSFLKHASGFGPKDSARGFARNHPIATAGLVGGGGLFLGEDIVAPIAGGLNELINPLEWHEDALRETEAFDRYQETASNKISRKLEAERLSNMVERNMAAVARNDPHLYKQVMAGRVLPKGAVVLGGPRRQDLMEELAYAMGTSSSPEEFSSLIS